MKLFNICLLLQEVCRVVGLWSSGSVMLPNSSNARGTMEGDSRLSELTRYELSIRDMLMTLHALRLAEKADALDYRSICLDMAVIAYARPFVKNHGTPGWSALKLETLFDSPLDAEDIALHQLALKLRNTVVAHSDAEMATTLATTVEGVMAFGTVISTLVDLQPEIARFTRLASEVRCALLDKLKALGNALGRPAYRPQPRLGGG